MTHTMKKTTMAVAAVALIAGALPASAHAATDDAVIVVPTPTPSRIDRANALKLQAEALYSQPKQWRKAVRLLEQSAELREANDPEAYNCLIYAGRIRSALGDMNGARSALEKAANHALMRGAIVEAAHALMDAAHVAIEDRQPQAAVELVQRARLLAESPLLSDEQKHYLTARF